MHRSSLVTVLVALIGAESLPAQRADTHIDRVMVVTLDGMRWQEVFGGAARELISEQAGGVADTQATLRRFWRETAEERREALMPFLWGTMARQGWMLGDSLAGSMVRVTNGKWFSYPGYNELLTGAPDDRIDANEKLLNPNVSVLEWLGSQPAFTGQVAAFGSWDLLPYILNTPRSGIPANGDGPPVADPVTETEKMMNALAADLPPYWGNVRFDGVTMQGALHHLTSRHPRVLYVLLGDTDEWAHERRYDLYLDAAQRVDRFLKTLWETVQSMPAYRNRTALLVTTDHGRGNGNNWTEHGRRVPAAGRVWMAGLLPGTISQKPIANSQYTQSQFAATIAAVLGLEAGFRKDHPRSAPSIFSP